VWLVVPLLSIVFSVYLVVTPIVVDPKLEYVYVLAFMAIGKEERECD
jgi:hypothetical protein